MKLGFCFGTQIALIGLKQALYGFTLSALRPKTKRLIELDFYIFSRLFGERASIWHRRAFQRATSNSYGQFVELALNAHQPVVVFSKVPLLNNHRASLSHNRSSRHNLLSNARYVVACRDTVRACLHRRPSANLIP
jgi:hypothetical protein